MRRPDLTNDLILETIKKFKGNVNLACKNLKCSYRLVHDVKTGKRKDPSEWTLQNSPPPPPKNPCTCCGTKEKKKGLQFLCDDCYKDGGDDMSEELSILTPTPVGVLYDKFSDYC